MPFFSRVFKSKDGAQVKKGAEIPKGFTPAPQKPRYASTWDSSEVVPEEVEELIHLCTLEMKSRAEALSTPFILLPFRPEGDVTPARTFIRNYFRANRDGANQYRGEPLKRELRLTEPEVLCSIVKWCWSRIPDGVVSWATYEGFRTGEKESSMAINSFDAFIPLSVESGSRRNIIYDFFDLIASIAANGKANGMGGRKISRMAGWWAFEQADTGKGFDGGYRSWAEAADASSHLFFAYLRSQAPEAVNGITGISKLPRSLQALVAQTEYPPETPVLMQSTTSKVLMIVDSVSPTPFSLLRRARLFEYRADDQVLQKFAAHSDPVDALSFECKRVLESIASTNQNSASRSRGNLAASRLPSGLSITSTNDDSWSRFQDEGFTFAVDSAAQSPQKESPPLSKDIPNYAKMQARAQSRLALGGRPTTPSWADFLNAGFVEDGKHKSSPNLLLSPERMLPPISDRQNSTPGQNDEDDDLEPGELASIIRFEMDDSFWWVWMTSLAAEETAQRKAAFGRCCLAETSISGGRWLVLEEQVKGASPGPENGAYIAEKKSRFTFSRRNRSQRKKKTEAEPPKSTVEPPPQDTKATVSADKQAKISAAAAILARQQDNKPYAKPSPRRGRFDDAASTKTSSILTVGLTSEVAPAMKWANAYDKDAIRRQYLGDDFAGRGIPREYQGSRTSSIYEDQKENENPAVRPNLTPVAEKPLSNPNMALPVRSDSSPTREKLSNRSKPLPSPQEVNKELEQQDVLPAPLPPKPPAVTVQAAADPQVETAAKVPLPDTSRPALQKSPSQASLPGRKPLSPESAQHVHPAFRSQGMDLRTETPSPAGATEETKSSPTSNEKTSPTSKNPKKIQRKEPGQSGLKKMFSKRKDPKRASADLTGIKSPIEPEQSTPAAAAAPAERLSPRPAGRQPSKVRERVQNLEARHSAAPPTPPTQETRQQAPFDFSRVNTTATTMPPSDSQHQEFSRFDQGPLDAPAFVPRSSMDDASISITSPSVPTFPEESKEGNTTLHTPVMQEPAHFAKSQQALVTNDTVSEVSAIPEEDEDTAGTAGMSHSDRWAQIKRNAAERAARASGEQSRSRGQSSVGRSVGTERTDDGETSGEETIEEKVARIKARVAHLTGDMNNR